MARHGGRRWLMRWLLGVGALLAAGCVAGPARAPAEALKDIARPAGLNLFVVAHQDDWQLFMMPDAGRAIAAPEARAVFVHLTAGDAGEGAGEGAGGPSATPYYRAREEGALRAVRFLYNAANPDAGAGARMSREWVVRGGKRMERFSYHNAVVYFLRLPDGNGPGRGSGYESTGFQSLQRLRDGAVSELRAVDGSEVYRGWDDLVGAVAAVFAAERRSGEAVHLHVTEKDAAFNAPEHSDHIHAALAAEAAAEGARCLALTRHDTYSTRSRPANLTGDDAALHFGVWAATASGLSDLQAPSTWEPGHNGWLARRYARLAAPATGC
ncbi:hypothetical protein GC169_04475 [bacterium]|nr:hypothetical protein [bacterium]